MNSGRFCAKKCGVDLNQRRPQHVNLRGNNGEDCLFFKGYVTVSCWQAGRFLIAQFYWAIAAGQQASANRPEIWASTRPSSLMKRLTVFCLHLTLRQQITMKEPKRTFAAKG